MNGLSHATAGVVSVRSNAIQSALLRSPEFDFTLVAVTTVAAITAGIAALTNPNLFVPILILDLWLLGYQHVVATYTRLVFDTESLAKYRFIALGLPVLVAAVTFAAAFWVGPWIVASTYLYWQWFHYTRQSYGIGRMYLRKVETGPLKNDPVTFGVIYLLPLWGILRRSAQHPDKFLGLDLVTVPVPHIAVQIVAAAALVSIALWIPREISALRRDLRRVPYACYMVSHLAIFSIGYLLIDSINVGWLVLNVWHNLQYLFIVWMFNTNRFKKGIDPQHRFISTISQPQSVALYVGTSLVIATVLFLAIQQGVQYATANVMSVSFAVYMTINFHHYLVDAVIWRRRQASSAPVRDPLPV